MWDWSCGVSKGSTGDWGVRDEGSRGSQGGIKCFRTANRVGIRERPTLTGLAQGDRGIFDGLGIRCHGAFWESRIRRLQGWGRLSPFWANGGFGQLTQCQTRCGPWRQQ